LSQALRNDSLTAKSPCLLTFSNRIDPAQANSRHTHPAGTRWGKCDQNQIRRHGFRGKIDQNGRKACKAQWMLAGYFHRSIMAGFCSNPENHGFGNDFRLTAGEKLYYDRSTYQPFDF